MIEASPEYLGDLVQQLYLHYLHRTPDSSEIVLGVRFVTSVGTVEQFEVQIAGSPEYFQMRGGNTNEGFLQALYQDALNRPIDPAGNAVCSQALNAGASSAQLAAAVFASDEFRQDLVGNAYQHFLDRPIQPADFAYWSTPLQNGITDAGIMDVIICSPEFSARL
jgi:hypothetical protein